MSFSHEFKDEHPLSEYDFGDVITLDRFKANVAVGGFIDYDGCGYAVADDTVDISQDIRPSKLHEIPSGTTHILWFNR